MVELLSTLALGLAVAQTVKHFDPLQTLERTCFQTGRPYSDRVNIRADVAIVYGIDKTMPERVKSWRDRGYQVHLMTGVAWGEYQDYYYGRFDGVNHEDEAQTKSNGEKIGHGGDVYYMSPGVNYGKFLSVGVLKALDAGVEAVHLEEPEFWSWGGYGEGFKREWKAYYNEPWQAPDSSPDARYRAAKLMYYLYRRALQQVFDAVQDYNQKHGTKARCYVPTHSLLNYASWGIVSPESSLARLKGCDGYIAQVWTGTARTPNTYRGVSKERTFETAFLEYGSMQNLVRSTGRSVWYLADPIEDNADHDWVDYQTNWESTLTASLLQPDVAQYEVMPWPDRIYYDNYPSSIERGKRVPIPNNYATELQVVINSLKDMKQKEVKWEGGSHGIGVVVSDSLMFQRGEPSPSDGQLNHIYGLAMPFVKRGMPVQPIQLENVTLKGYLKGMQVLLMTYDGMKPMSPEVHSALADWVKAGGTLVFVDPDTDPYKAVREWWNEGEHHFATPREHLFQLICSQPNPTELTKAGKGSLMWLKRAPSEMARDPKGSEWLVEKVKLAAPKWKYAEANYILLRRGPYVIGAGFDESAGAPRTLKGEYIDLFDFELKARSEVELTPNSRHFLVDLNKWKKPLIAAAGAVVDQKSTDSSWSGTIEGQELGDSVVLLRIPRAPDSATIEGQDIVNRTYDSQRHLLWLRFDSRAKARRIEVRY